MPVPEDKAPEARYHLLTKPLAGGMPIRARDATVMQPRVRGITFPSPRICSTLVHPVVTIMAPAAKNRVCLIMEWNTTWLKAPTKAAGVSRLSPNIT